MQSLLSLLPDLEALTLGLEAALVEQQPAAGEIRVLAREPNVMMSTFPSEVVTCRLDGRDELRVFCKYEAGLGHGGFGHRGGVGYEAEVYRQVLEPLGLTTPAFYGSHLDTATGDAWLFLEYLDQMMRVSQGPGVDAMRLAARWIAQFHRMNEARVSQLPFLLRYDADYYVGWARRTSEFAGDRHRAYPWLATLCERFEALVDSLLAPPLTVIHGEYYSLNIPYRDGRVHPVDWQSAAIATGEIDLATVTDGWDTETTRACELEYQRVRWPEGAPADFERRLDAARLYAHLRWLGDHRELTLRTEARVFDELGLLARRLGLL